MQKYSEYMAVPAPWLGELPSHWDAKKIGALFSERKTKVSDKDYQPLSVAKIGVVPQLETAVKTDAGDNRKLVRAGDFVINSRSDRKGSCGVSELDGSVSLINIVLTPREQLNGRYVHYLMRSQPFSEEYYRNGRGIVADLWTTRYSEMKTILLPVPPIEEQEKIVSFLDWKMSSINKLITTKVQQIGLLREREAVHISRVVICGLDPKTAKKDSCVEWIGEIPVHWETMRCKYLFRERDERSKEGKEQHLSMSQKYGLVPDSQLDERRMLSESYKGGKLCYCDDLVLNRLKAHLGVFALAPQLGVISPDYTVLVPNVSKILPAYAEMALKSIRCRGELRIRVRGIVEGFWRLYTDDFNTIVLPVPPLEEQAIIMQHIAEYKQRTKAYSDILSQEIAVLQELKMSIISDAVTGKIDVRNVEIPEFVYVDEEVSIEDINGSENEPPEEE